jgi:hypothetical protein
MSWRPDLTGDILSAYPPLLGAWSSCEGSTPHGTNSSADALLAHLQQGTCCTNNVPRQHKLDRKGVIEEERVCGSS